jgi:hypothetical protein
MKSSGLEVWDRVLSVEGLRFMIKGLGFGVSGFRV